VNVAVAVDPHAFGPGPGLRRGHDLMRGNNGSPFTPVAPAT
jgi:hypothetical protein